MAEQVGFHEVIGATAYVRRMHSLDETFEELTGREPVDGDTQPALLAGYQYRFRANDDWKIEPVR